MQESFIIDVCKGPEYTLEITPLYRTKQKLWVLIQLGVLTKEKNKDSHKTLIINSKDFCQIDFNGFNKFAINSSMEGVCWLHLILYVKFAESNSSHYHFHDRSLSHRNQSIDLEWFLYDRSFCHERVKIASQNQKQLLIVFLISHQNIKNCQKDSGGTTITSNLWNYLAPWL